MTLRHQYRALTRQPEVCYVIYHLEDREGGLGLHGGMVAVFYGVTDDLETAKRLTRDHPHRMYQKAMVVTDD